MGEKNRIKSCYIHIPFCKKICSYCDFCKNFYNDNIIDSYLNSLHKEIKKIYKGDVLNTIYIGGGTPSSLSADKLVKLFNVLKIFKLSDKYEYTFECNYEDINDDLLSILKKNKINRLSIGIQTFNEKYSKVLNRNINRAEIIKKVFLAKKYFNNINVDLMYALPSQSINDLKNDLKEFIKLDVTHISTYALIVEEHTKLYIDKIKEVSDDIQNDMYYLIVDTLKENGYNHYEISNFSKEGYFSKHNLTYWNNDNYYGFGLGASSFIENKRIDNTRSINNYINGKIIMNKDSLNTKSLIKDEIMLSLRKTSGINKKDFYNKYNKKISDVFNYNDILKNNLLKETDDYLFIPEEKLFISNEIIIQLLDSYTLN